MPNAILRRDFESSLTEELGNSNTGEIPIYLSKAPDSQIGYLMFEPGVAGQTENVLHHKVIGNVAYIYGVNRSNPVIHPDNSRVILSNSIDYLNYAIGQINEQTFIYKKSTQHFVCKGGSFFIGSESVVIPDLDTEDQVVGKTLIVGALNYLFIKDYDYFITDTYETGLYLVAVINVSIGGILNSLNKINTYSIGTIGETGATGVQGISGYHLILRNSAGYMQWALDNGSPTWENLVALNDIKGPAGDLAVFRVDPSGTWIQYKFESDVSWTNLITTLSLQGPKGDTGGVGAPGINGVSIQDTTGVPVGTVTHDDNAKTVTVTEPSGYYTIYGENSIIKYDNNGNPIATDNSVVGLYNNGTIEYITGETIDTTGEVTFEGKLAYTDQSNIFTKINTFDGDIIFNARVSMPFAEMGLIGNDIIFDGNKSQKQYKVLTDTVAKTISFKNLTSGVNYEFAIVTIGSTVLSKGTVTDSIPISKVYTFRGTDGIDFLPFTLTGPDVYIFTGDTYNTAVHLSKPILSRESV